MTEIPKVIEPLAKAAAQLSGFYVSDDADLSFFLEECEGGPKDGFDAYCRIRDRGLVGL